MRKQALQSYVGRSFQTEGRAGARTLRLWYDAPERAGVERAKGQVLVCEVREVVGRNNSGHRELVAELTNRSGL